jgi:pyruvate/2-oxoglutarate dehydrogenase complex dihydrolipoamide acyltransferase (E2) component
MARVPIVMPVLGFEQETGRVAGWLRGIGDRVERGDPIAEIVAESGAEVAVGQPIAWLDDSGG